MCSKAFSDIDEKHGAESEVLSGTLGICTVGLFWAYSEQFADQHQGRILDLSPGVVGRAEPFIGFG